MIISILLICLCSAASFAMDIINPASVNMMAYSQRPVHNKGENFYPVSVIRPIGWSKDGKFAYVSETVQRGLGGIKFTYIIIDAVSDNIVWKYDDKRNNLKVSIKDSILKHKEIILNNLKKYKIVQGKGIVLKKFPIKKDGDEFAVKLIEVKKNAVQLQELKESGIAPFRGDLQVMQVRILLNGIKKKTIITQNDPAAYAYWISGYFMSPFEKRILVAIGQNTRGFEGIEGEFIFSGSSLDRGFK